MDDRVIASWLLITGVNREASADDTRAVTNTHILHAYDGRITRVGVPGSATGTFQVATGSGERQGEAVNDPASIGYRASLTHATVRRLRRLYVSTGFEASVGTLTSKTFVVAHQSDSQCLN